MAVSTRKVSDTFDFCCESVTRYLPDSCNGTGHISIPPPAPSRSGGISALDRREDILFFYEGYPMIAFGHPNFAFGHPRFTRHGAEEDETAKVARQPPQLTGGAAAPELRGGLIPAARSRKTPVRDVLSPSLRPHMRDSIRAAATKLREPAAMPPFQV